RKILLQLSEQFDQGLLLNQIDLGNYNSLDAALLYFQAVHEYYYYTKDKQTVRKLLPVMETTLNSLAKGSKYGIKLNKSGFLIWESPKEALTWMDAKTAQGPVTPRQGAPIEIQALWYNALQVTEKLAAEVSFKLRTGTQIDTFEHMLEMNFSKQFWLEDKNYFTDVIDQFGNKDIKLRPNQLIAFSLAFPIGSKQHWEKLENKIETELYSPVGLKTLSSDHPEYKGEYSGDQTERDMAYHQGTIWPWLLQPYFIGLIRFNKGGRRIVREKLDLFYEKIRLHGLDSVPELFSADRNEPRGAIAQAWSVAALLESVMYLNDTRPEIE
ncbi:MAG: amylo-alpha-1,6-glucosidase, partial [Candidatus Dojkabacteria bacterium]